LHTLLTLAGQKQPFKTSVIDEHISHPAKNVAIVCITFLTLIATLFIIIVCSFGIWWISRKE